MNLRDSYDTVARAYDAQLAGELDHKPLDRALLTAFLELAGPGPVADVGCGPGHVTRFLAARHPGVLGLDLSPAMVAIARERAPGLPFAVASMLALPVPDGAWGGAVALYSTTHLTSWFGSAVDVDVHLLDPARVGSELAAAGFRIESTLLREPLDPAEFPSRRAYLLACRD
jgi:SAM-dependent methyltransferase